jgi:hypothetical protein
MDAMTFIRQQVEFMHQLVGASLAGIDDEQLNWSPPGTINPINAILLHMLFNEDEFIQASILDRSTLWQENSWAGKLGVPTVPERGKSWDDFRTSRLSTVLLLAYREAVMAATQACLQTLSSSDLDRQVKYHGEALSISDILQTLLVHGAHHAGEIAAVRGMQGVRGLPF